MATSKVLAQSFPSAATYTKIYTAPKGISTSCFSMIVCNQSIVSTSFRVAIRVSGAADSTKDKLYYDLPIEGNDSFEAALGDNKGITLASSDEIWVYATLGTLSFNLLGEENI